MLISLVQSFSTNVLAFLPQLIKNQRIAMQKHYIPKSNCYQKQSQIIKPRVYLRAKRKQKPTMTKLFK